MMNKLTTWICCLLLLLAGCEADDATETGELLAGDGSAAVIPGPNEMMGEGAFGAAGVLGGTESAEAAEAAGPGAGEAGSGDTAAEAANPDSVSESSGESAEILNPTQDTDGDQIYDINDNCPAIPNSGQEDLDDDQIGNACDADLDGDGMSNLQDCAPFDNQVHAFAKELCNGIDDNCDGVIDENPEDECFLFYPDEDGDGSGAIGQGLCLCNPTESHPTPFGGDCNDTTEYVSSFAPEICDGNDNNCNDVIDEGCDDDQDGYCDMDMLVTDGATETCPNGGGDCVDFSADIFPGAEEINGDGFDNDCDGVAKGDAIGGQFVVDCPADCLAIGDEVDSYLCAMGMCFDEYILSAKFFSPSGTEISSFHDVVAHLGDLSNDLAPFEGESYGLLGTGPVGMGDLFGGYGGYGGYGGSTGDPFSPGDETYDNAEFIVEMTAPASAVGFSVDYIFMSQEYEEYIGTEFNDKFYMILKAPVTTGGQKKIVNTATCSNPNSYFDTEDENGNKQCYIAINTAFSEKCGQEATDISGSGDSCSEGGSSTGWLTTSWPIQANETFTLTFHIHDTGDSALSSKVILDNFRFETIPGDFSPGTTNAN